MVPAVGQYVPGDFTAVLGTSVLVVWDARDSPASVAAVWQAAAAGSGLHALLAALAGPAGWDRLPAFALVAREGTDLRVLVRGDVEVVVSRGGGPDVTVAAASVSTWLESAVQDATAVRVLAGDAHQLPMLPLAAGAVPACRVLWDLAGSGAQLGPVSGPLPVPGPFAEPAGTADRNPAPDRVAEPSFEARPAQSDEHTLVPADLPAGTLDGIAQPRDTFGDTFVPAPLPVGAVPDVEVSLRYELLHAPEPAEPPRAEPPRTESRPAEPEPAARERVIHAPTSPDPGAPGPAPEPEPRPAEPVTEPISTHPTTPYPDDGGLISSSPWSLSTQVAAPAPEPVQPTAWSPLGKPLPFGQLEPEPDRSRLGDHDETTILRSELERPDRPRPAGGMPSPTVLAALCPDGHPNPPTASQCRLCGAAIPAQDPVPVHRPSLGRLRASIGDDIELDRPAVIGRMPRRDGMVGEEMPQLVEVTNKEQDLSRSHLEIRIDGWQVRVVDLDSRNGTFVALPGRNAERLRPFEPTLVVPGTVILLSQDVTYSYEVAG
jgi:hypothetical protein